MTYPGVHGVQERPPRGFQSLVRGPKPSNNFVKKSGKIELAVRALLYSRTLLQGILTLKHQAANSLEHTAPRNRHTFDANAAFGVDPDTPGRFTKKITHPA